jgi:hypothetical protein
MNDHFLSDSTSYSNSVRYGKVRHAARPAASRLCSKRRVSLSLRTRKDSGNSFINDNYAFMSLGALNDPQRVVVSPERAIRE